MMSPFKNKSTKVTLDACSECDGLWLDHGELSQIDGRYDRHPHGVLDIAASRLRTLFAHLERRQSTRVAQRLSDFDQDRSAVLGLEEQALLEPVEVLSML